MICIILYFVGGLLLILDEGCFFDVFDLSIGVV